MIRTRAGILLSILAAGGMLAAPGLSGAVPDYPLTKIAPKGFAVYQGIVDWVPVSGTKAIAFARNRAKSSWTSSLVGYSLSKTGVCSSPRTIASGMGSPRAAAAFWIDEGGAGRPGAAPYGLIFVLFEDSAKNYDTATVSAAKFSSSGALVGAWRPILKLTTPKGWYIGDEDLFATRGGQSIGVVPSLVLYKSRANGEQTLIDFLEADIKDGRLIGSATQLPLPSDGQDIEGRGFTPAWNGTSWLVPVTAAFYKPGGDWEDILKNELLVGVVSGGTTHTAVLNKIAADRAVSFGTYEAVLTPYPGSAADWAMFVRHRTPIPTAKQKLDMFKYDFSLKRLDVAGRLVKTASVSIPAYVHELVYDAAFKIRWDWEYWSAGAAQDGTVLLSRARTIEFDKESPWAAKFEHELDFYAVNLKTGAVAHKARAVTLWPDVDLFRPLIDVFPGGPIGVINCAYHVDSPYPWDNYLTTFAN